MDTNEMRQTQVQSSRNSDYILVLNGDTNLHQQGCMENQQSELPESLNDPGLYTVPFTDVKVNAP